VGLPENNSKASAPCTVPKAPPSPGTLRAFTTTGSANAYKAQRAGVPVVAHTPAYTSHSCSGCGHVHRKNRRTRDDFLCTRCTSSLPADLNAAINIAVRGADDWAVSHAAPRHRTGRLDHGTVSLRGTSRRRAHVPAGTR